MARLKPEFIVVGAGSAGCVLAGRLTERGHSVLLIEAGPPDSSLKIRAPSLYFTLWRTDFDWAFQTEPQTHADGRRMFWPRGKVLGGSSSLNAMVYIRGHRSNYDEWRDLGCPGWGYADVLPYFKRSEDYRGRYSEYHGRGGPLTVSIADSIRPVSEAFVEAACRVTGAPHSDDFNGAEQEGFGQFHQTVRDGERCSAAVAFLRPAMARPELEVLTGAQVCRVVIEDGRARGVRVRQGASERTIFAEREVILSAGAIGSPQLLLLSGIGPADQLGSLGVPVVADLQGVGENLQDHIMTGVSYRTLKRGSRYFHLPMLAGWLAQYLATGRGPLATTPLEVGGFMRRRPDDTRPTFQLHFVPYGIGAPNSDEPVSAPFGRYFTLLPSLIYPKSVGTLRLRSARPEDPPAIDPRCFSEPEDLDVLVEGVRLSREIAHASPLADFRGEEILPGPDATSDAEIRAKVRMQCSTIFHPVGTCKMGSDERAVVDPELRVRGVGGLRVVDGSIMPTIVGGNTNAPIIMIAEKAVDLITAG